MELENLNLVYISIQYVNLDLIKIFKLGEKKSYIQNFKFLYFRNLKKALL